MFPLRLISSGTKKKKKRIYNRDNSFIVFTRILQEFTARTMHKGNGKKTDGRSLEQQAKVVFACISRSMEKRKCTESKENN